MVGGRSAVTAATTAASASAGMAVEAGLCHLGLGELIVEVGHRGRYALQRVTVLDLAVRTPLGERLWGSDARREQHGARDQHATRGGENQPSWNPNDVHWLPPFFPR